MYSINQIPTYIPNHELFSNASIFSFRSWIISIVILILLYKLKNRLQLLALSSSFFAVVILLSYVVDYHLKNQNIIYYKNEKTLATFSKTVMKTARISYRKVGFSGGHNDSYVKVNYDEYNVNGGTVLIPSRLHTPSSVYIYKN